MAAQEKPTSPRTPDVAWRGTAEYDRLRADDHTPCDRCYERGWKAGAAAATPSLDSEERLAEAWFVGTQAQSGRNEAEALARWNDGSEDMDYMRGKYLDVARHALARLDEGSAARDPER